MPRPLRRFEVMLLVLLQDSPSCGYAILKDRESCQSYFGGQPSSSSLYHALHKLKTQRLICGRQRVGVQAPDRTVYKVSAAGRRLLTQTLAEEVISGYRQLFRIQAEYATSRQWISRIERLVQPLLPSGSQYRAQSE